MHNPRLNTIHLPSFMWKGLVVFQCSQDAGFSYAKKNKVTIETISVDEQNEKKNMSYLHLTIYPFTKFHYKRHCSLFIYPRILDFHFISITAEIKI